VRSHLADRINEHRFSGVHEQKIRGEIVRNTTGLKRGGPGRPKGRPNNSTIQVKQFCASILDDPAYQLGVRQRALRGQLAPAIEALLWHYRWGKPKEEAQVQGTLVVRWQGEDSGE
jgi:hypothetical protein